MTQGNLLDFGQILCGANMGKVNDLILFSLNPFFVLSIEVELVLWILLLSFIVFTCNIR